MTQIAMRNGPTRGKWPGITAIDVNGERYCLDCAKEVLDGREVTYQLDNGTWETVTNANGEGIVEQMINGDIYTLSMGGVVLRNSVDDGNTWHCSLGSNCVNAIPGEEHDYDHNVPIGVKLDV